MKKSDVMKIGIIVVLLFLVVNAGAALFYLRNHGCDPATVKVRLNNHTGEDIQNLHITIEGSEPAEVHFPVYARDEKNVFVFSPDPEIRKIHLTGQWSRGSIEWRAIPGQWKRRLFIKVTMLPNGDVNTCMANG